VAYGPISASLAGATLAVAAVVLALRPWLKLSGPSFGSVFQGAIRPNTYVGVAPVFALWGDDGLTILALAIVSVIPLVNLLSVIVVSRTVGDGRPASAAELVLLVLKNPLIVACLLGLAFSMAGVALPSVVQTILQWLGTAAMPIGLLTVGAALDLTALRGALATIVLTSTLKLVLFPAIVALIGLSLGLSGTALGVVLLYGGLPISASAYVLARLLGGDATLVAGTLTATTLGAFITLPIIILILSST
jgi:predicted permease